MGRGHVLGGVPDDERLVRGDRAAGDDRRSPQRRLGELATVGRVRAVATEGEEAVEPGPVQLDVGGGLHVAGDQPEQVALVEHPWQQLLDAARFLDRWGGEAARLGWSTLDLFGVHPTVPAARYAAMGLVPLIRGGEVISITESSATIRMRSGSELTYLHGVAVSRETSVPDDLDAIEVPAGRWAVFRSAGDYPQSLQSTWAATATEWFPANPWRLRPGPSMVAVLERADDFSTATCDLWLPVEPS